MCAALHVAWLCLPSTLVLPSGASEEAWPHWGEVLLLQRSPTTQLAPCLAESSRMPAVSCKSRVCMVLATAADAVVESAPCQSLLPTSTWVSVGRVLPGCFLLTFCLTRRSPVSWCLLVLFFHLVLSESFQSLFQKNPFSIFSMDAGFL